MIPRRGVDGYKLNETRTKDVIEKNSVTDVLPYPAILAKGKAPESFRAKSSPYRAAKYPSKFEKPSYGAPTQDDLDLAQVRKKVDAIKKAVKVDRLSEFDNLSQLIKNWNKDLEHLNELT